MRNKFKARKSYAAGVQSIPPRPTSSYSEGEQLAGLGSSIASGAATGGIPGAFIGAFTGLMKRDKEKRAAAELLEDQQHAWKTGLIAQAQDNVLKVNEDPQQRAQIANGIDGAPAEEVEVEKDELIFTKSATGKYTLKADFHGGKAHNEGGEDYQTSEGDIIFPGKDRKKVLAAYQNQNTPKLESMRMKLPKTASSLSKAEDGLDKSETNPTQQYRAILDKVDAGELPQSYADNFYAENKANIHDPNLIQQGLYGLDKFLGNINPITQAWRGAGHLANFVQNDVTGSPNRDGANYTKPTTLEEQYGGDKGFNVPLGGESLTGDQMVEDLNSFRSNYSKNNVAWYGPDQRLSGKRKGKPLALETPVTTTPKTGGGGGNRTISGGNVQVQGLDNGGGLVEVDTFGNMGGAQIIKGADPVRDMTKGEARLAAKIKRQGARGGFDAGTGGNFDFGAASGYAAQGLSALTNLFPGKAEVQTTPQIQLDRLRYQDTSNNLRQASNINERVQASNARNVSGGNVQNYLANRRQAGLSNLQTQQTINAEEYRRSLGIANQNRMISGRETMYNSRIGMQDEQVNAANRGARRNIINAGYSQLGELGATVSRDRNANKNQAELRKAISSGMYRIGADGTIELNV